MDFDQAYLAYDRHITNVETLAYNTRRGYLGRVDPFLAYLVDLGYRDTTEITADLAADFMADTYAALADRTYNLYVTQVRQFLKFLREESALGDDQAPERKLKTRRRPQPSPSHPKKFVHVEEVDGYAVAAGDWHVRDEYLVRFLSGFARRAEEICTMTVGDVDLNPRGSAEWGVFRFTNAKTGKTKFLPIQEHVAPHLRRWLKIYAQLLKRDVHKNRELSKSDPLLPALKRGPGATFVGMRHPLVINPDRHLCYASVQEALERAEVPGAHPLRRGMLVDIKDRLGIRAAKLYADHADEKTTEVYMDERREVDDLGKALSKEAKDRGKKARKKAAKAAAKAGVPSLTDRRDKARRAS